MSCHKCLIYTRMVIYLCTIAIHSTNSIVILFSLSEEAMKIQGVRDFYETRFFFFTCWTFMIQIAYAAFGLICDGMSLRDTAEKKTILPPIVTNFREKVFTVFVWPSALMVSSYFWVLYAYDRNLLYPEFFETVITHTSNHIMHTLIVPIVLCEIVLFPRRKPDGSVLRICCIVGLEVVYIISLFYVHYTKGIWVYPLFALLDENTVYLVLFLGFTAVYLTAMYYVQFYVSNIVLKCWEKIGERFCKACKK